jgi:hypothetical protein
MMMSLNHDKILAWHTQADITLPNLPGIEAQARDQTVAATTDLVLPAERLERLMQAVGAAVRNASKRSQPVEEACPVCIRVMVALSPEAGVGLERGQGMVEALDSRTTGSGWGFFVIEKMISAVCDDTGRPIKAAHHLVELFLYQEGEAVKTEVPDGSK